MLGLLYAFIVAVLFSTGTYMVLQRSPIRLILGLGLLSHGVNLLLFSTGMLQRGLPPIVADKANFHGDIGAFVDPLPQALILTAIVISFGITAFIVVLINRRNTLVHGEAETRPGDPFALLPASPQAAQAAEDDYEYLEYTLVDEYRQRESSGSVKR